MITERRNSDGSLTIGIIEEEQPLKAEPKEEPKAEKPKAKKKSK